MAILLGFSICLAFILATIALYYYGKIQTQYLLVSLAVLIAWSFSFLIVFVIPLDVTATVYRQCLAEHNATSAPPVPSDTNTTNITTTSIPPEIPCVKPPGMVNENVLPNLWRIIYWTTQFLTWLVMPMMQSYLKAGDFTIKGKLKSALIDNAIYYGSYLLICVILLIYLAMKPDVHLDWQKLKAIASSASNTWGLFLLVLLLGYALVEVPRGLFNHSKPGYTLQYAYFKLSKMYSDKLEAEEHVDDVLESLQAANHAVPMHHELRSNIDTILCKVPTELLDRAARNVRRDNSPQAVPSEKALVRLHRQVIKSLQTLQRTEALWNIQVKKVLHLEDVARNLVSPIQEFKSDFPRERSNLCDAFYTPTVEWYWECLIRPPFLRVMAFITTFLSVTVVWSEITFFNESPVLSIFAILVKNAKANYDFVTIELISTVVLCYLCYCAYSTVFRIKFLNLYYLAPHHQTNEYSLIFTGMLLSRLTPPMCLNFLGLIQMDSHIIKVRIQETQFTQVMGHMDVISIVSDGFNIYFPMFLLAFCLATWFSLGSRLLSALGFQQFMSKEEIVSELVQEGKDLIAREKRRLQRQEESFGRRRDPTRDRTLRDFTRREPGDGLLRESVADYSTTAPRSETDFPRSLSEEINERFGISTQPTVGFRDERNNDDDRRRGPPRGLFDDV